MEGESRKMSLKDKVKEVVLGYRASSDSYVKHLRKIGVEIGEDVVLFRPYNTTIDSDKTSNMLNDIEFNGMRCNIDDLKEMSVEEIDLNRKRNYIVDLEKVKEESKEHFKEFDKCLY